MTNLHAFCTFDGPRPLMPPPSTSRWCSLGAVALSALALAIATAGCGAANGDRPTGGPPAVPVTIATVQQKTMPYEDHAIGNVQAYSSVAIKARVGGELEAVHFREGDEVSKGQLLFTIDPRPSQAAVKQAEGVLARDQALLKKAEDDVTRYAGLVEKDFVTKEQFDQITATAASLRATVKSDEASLDNARLQLGYCTITAPISGRTGNLAVKAGNLIKADDTNGMVTINQDRPIYVQFSVPEQDLPEIRAHQRAGALKVEAIIRQDHAHNVEGALSFIDNAVDTTTGTIMLKATFPNQDGALWPGQFVDVLLYLGEQADAIVVPNEAVVAGQVGQYAFVVGADDTVESRTVKVDRVIAGETVVADGLKPGDRVVTDGQLRLAPGMKVVTASIPAEAGGK
jgi:multidrug efflux system membrane fusion protein